MQPRQMGGVLPDRLNHPAASAMSGINGTAEQLLENLEMLHGAIFELEIMLENGGLLQPAPPTPGMAGAVEKAPHRISDRLRNAQSVVQSARDRILTLRDRVDV